MSPTIRPATADDVPRLADLYHDSVLAAGPGPYSPQQLTAWADSARDTPRFTDFVLRPTTFLAEIDGRPAGFAGIEPDGHIASLYIAAHCHRRGVGALLLGHLLAHARDRGIPRVYAEASEFSRTLFVRHGFRVTRTDTRDYGGQWFLRYIVARDL